jgi:hypothetical protein
MGRLSLLSFALIAGFALLAGVVQAYHVGWVGSLPMAAWDQIIAPPARFATMLELPMLKVSGGRQATSAGTR